MNSHFLTDGDVDKTKAIKLPKCVTSIILLRFEKADLSGPVASFKH